MDNLINKPSTPTTQRTQTVIDEPKKRIEGKKKNKDLLIKAEQIYIDKESDVLRKFMCEKILEKLKVLIKEKSTMMNESEKNEFVNTKISRKQTDITAKRDEIKKSPIEGILISRYVIDFGHIIVGSSKKKQFKLCNTGQMPISFNLDVKQMKLNQFSIEPNRIKNLPPGESASFNITMATTKKDTFGTRKNIIPFEIKGGATYDLELKANITRPDMIISTDYIDFESTYVSNTKSSIIRLENNKEVNCEWQYVQKQSVDARVKDHLRFNVVPSSGTLTPGQKFLVSVNFTPT